MMNNTILKTEHDFSVLKDTDSCVFCNKDTGVPSCSNVDMRKNYIDGAGQLCDECFVRIYDKINLV
jgi:hypothetical protein